ncbi:protein kinase [Streptomyces sp. SID4919]|uniref:serine/threonine-protein kinase n=1 Tax=unclassified Streptomyces TaxID=2593676 RepID=UPI000823EBC9|nr:MULTISPECIES: serine/threonine-protein kinase [unclassified Streptomyces]MYY13710.1 protein kinase [Streptomyces sp. SID4919]SCK34414.1 Serine/threonine protein kinase [Streptomyces sp. AmelKG-E11A]
MTGTGKPVRGRYHLLRLLGRGGMGEVWLAHDEVLDRAVALKSTLVDDERARARLRTEARNIARCPDHPHIVSVFDFFVEEPACWIVMQYVASRTLAKVLRDEGPLDSAAVAAIGRQTADALAAAHTEGVVHRDVTPENMLVTATGLATLTDFGISSALWQGSARALTLSVRGKPPYLPPEVARGEAAGPAADVFGLGASLYAAVEGRSPWGEADHPAVYLARACGGETEPARRATRPFARVLTALLARDPADRPDAREAYGMLSAIGTGAGGGGGAGVGVGGSPGVPSPRERRRDGAAPGNPPEPGAAAVAGARSWPAPTTGPVPGAGVAQRAAELRTPDGERGSGAGERATADVTTVKAPRHDSRTVPSAPPDAAPGEDTPAHPPPPDSAPAPPTASEGPERPEVPGIPDDPEAPDDPDGPDRPGPGFPRRTAVLVALTGVLLAGTAGAGWWLWPWDGGSDGPSDALAGTRAVLGDVRSADPCALLDPTGFTSHGTASLHTAYGEFDRCDVLLYAREDGDGPRGARKGDFLADVQVDFASEPADLSSVPRTTRGAVTVAELPRSSDECERNLQLADGNQVWLSAEREHAESPDPCALVRTATDHAVKILNQGPVPARPGGFHAASLARVDACGLMDKAALAVIPGIDPADAEPDFANWGCDWTGGTQDVHIDLDFSRNNSLADDGTPARFDGRPGAVAAGEAGEDSCVVRTQHRVYTGVRGEQTIELVELTVAAPWPAEELCTRAKALATAVARRLPDV